MLVRFIFDESYVSEPLFHNIKIYKKVHNSGPLRTIERHNFTDQRGMITKIDFYFPFLVFSYGLVLTFVLEIPFFVKLARKEMPVYHSQFEKHRKLAFLSVFIGGLWSLQNLWFS